MVADPVSWLDLERLEFTYPAVKGLYDVTIHGNATSTSEVEGIKIAEQGGERQCIHRAIVRGTTSACDVWRWPQCSKQCRWKCNCQPILSALHGPLARSWVTLYPDDPNCGEMRKKFEGRAPRFRSPTEHRARARGRPFNHGAAPWPTPAFTPSPAGHPALGPTPEARAKSPPSREFTIEVCGLTPETMTPAAVRDSLRAHLGTNMHLQAHSLQRGHKYVLWFEAVWRVFAGDEIRAQMPAMTAAVYVSVPLHS